MITKFCNPLPGYYTKKMWFANASKIKANWLLTLELVLTLKMICNLPKWAQERTWM